MSNIISKLVSFMFLFGAILSVSLAPATINAEEEAKESQIYVVDMQRVVSESIAGKAARNNVEVEAKKMEVKLKKLKGEMAELGQNLSKQASLLSADALAEKKEQFRKKEREFARKIEDEKGELARLNQRELKKVVDEIDKVVAELAEKENYPFILERDPKLVVYANKQLDLTDRVIEMLNKRKLDL